MRSRTLAWAVLYLACWGNGCASAPAKSTVDYTGPTERALQSEVVVPMPIDPVWDKLVTKLKKSAFVIENVDPEARRIEVLYSTDSPERYCDCGTTKRTLEGGGERVDYVYPVAGSSTYRVADDRPGDVWHFQAVREVHRTASLEGRFLIEVSPQGQETRLSVEGRYDWTVRAWSALLTLNEDGETISGRRLPSESSSIRFATNRRGESEGGVVCVSTGVLEQQILGMVGVPPSR